MKRVLKLVMWFIISIFWWNPWNDKAVKNFYRVWDRKDVKVMLK